MIDCSCLSIKDTNIFFMLKNMIYYLESSLSVHSRRLFLIPTEWAKNGLSIMFIFDRSNAVAAELMFTG